MRKPGDEGLRKRNVEREKLPFQECVTDVFL